MAELLTIALAANEQKQFRKGGSYLEIIDSSYAVGINLYSDLGGQIDSINGALSGFFLGATFGAFDIKNGPAAQFFQILVLDPGETGGSRRQPGIVRVVDGEREKVSSGNCYRAIVSQNGGATAPAVGIYNSSSTKNVFVQAMRIGSSMADVFVLFRTTTNITAGAGMTAQGAGNNLSSAGAASSIAFCSGNPNPGIGAFLGVAQFVQGYLTANSDSVILMPRQILLLPGQALVAILSTAATNIRTSWEWEEW